MLTEEQKRDLSHEIQSNEHEIYILSLEEMDAIIRSSPKSNLPHIREQWESIKLSVENGANLYAAGGDSRKLVKLIRDLGGFTNTAYIKRYGGKPHIILKGHPGLRKILTGTKYGITNPKVITMGLGKAGASTAIKSGGIVSIILMSAFRVTDYILSDEATLSQLVGSLATDIVKVGIASGLAYGAVALVASAGVTLAIGPLAAVVLVGGAATLGLNMLDKRFGITEKLIECIEEIPTKSERFADQASENFKNKAAQVAGSALDYVIDSTRRAVVDLAKHQIDKFITSSPRVY